LRQASTVPDPGDRIAFLSGQFLDIPYQASTLTGSDAEPEQLVIDLGAVDCFTLLDYVEAMRHAITFDRFVGNLKKIRYRDGLVSFKNRNHFFTDWAQYNQACISDVTGEVGGAQTQRIRKVLNVKMDGSFFVPGIPPVDRDMDFIPSGRIDDRVVGMLNMGDYAGIYSDRPGLDVSHTGVIIRDGADVVFRHASSVQGKVVDEDFRRYVAASPGLVVFRPQ
jgi:hypothetical protein